MDSNIDIYELTGIDYVLVKTKRTVNYRQTKMDPREKKAR